MKKVYEIKQKFKTGTKDTRENFHRLLEECRAGNLETQKATKFEKGTYISGMMFELSEFEHSITEFDEQLWMMVVETVTVYKDGRLVFRFRNGTEIEG